MTETDFIQERIINLGRSRKRYHHWTIALVIIGAGVVLYSIFEHAGTGYFHEELPKFGFGIMTTLCGLFSQNEKLKIDNKITSYKFLITQVDNDPTIKPQLIAKAISEI